MKEKIGGEKQFVKRDLYARLFINVLSILQETYQCFDKMDWSLCFLCQSDHMNGKIRHPLNSNNKHKDSAYVLFERNLLEFDRIGALPSNINIKNLDEGNGICHTLKKYNAVYHAYCAANVNTSRLSRKRPLNNNENSSAKRTRNCLYAVYENDCTNYSVMQSDGNRFLILRVIEENS